MCQLPLSFALATAMALSGTGPALDSASAQVAVVVKLYQAFAWETVIDGPRPQPLGLLDQPRQVLLRYFTPRLTSAILQDRAYAARTHSAGRLDFQPIWDSQDVSATTVRIVPGSSANTVAVRLNRCAQASEIVYSVVKTASGWRISDIQYGPERTSLSSLLQSTP